jgi:2-phosphosulfolactate phosphatase
MPKLHVVLKKEELDPDRLEEKVVIVLDILFATSTIVHIFGQGIACLYPARDAEDALAIAKKLNQPMLAGEYLAGQIPGFGPPTPLALAKESQRGTTLVYATTNGTVALSNAAKGAHVFVGALLNGAALVDYIVRHYPEKSVLLVCSGSVNRFNLEDFFGAGHFVAHFDKMGKYLLTDAAKAALLMYRGSDAIDVLSASLVGKKMIAHHLQAEVDCAAQIDVSDVVPEFNQGCVRLVDL